jgi:DNA-binding MarR family transcriptional regulator
MKTMQAFLKRAQFCGFTSLTQVRVFLALAEFEGETTAKAISEATEIEASMVSGVLKSLGAWNLVALEKRLVTVDGRLAPRIFATMGATGKTSLDMLRKEVEP